MRKYYFWIPAFIMVSLLLMSCMRNRSLTILSDHVEGPEKTGNSIISSLQKSLTDTGIKMTEKVDSSRNERSILDKINSGEEDMALIKNSITIGDSYSNIRTVMPLFPEVFLTLYKGSGQRLDSLIANGKVVFIIDKDEEQQLIERFLDMLQLTPAHYSRIKKHGETETLHHAVKNADVIMLLSSLNNPLISEMMQWEPGLKVHDFNSADYQYGSVIDGFCLRYSQAIPFTIPKGTFNNLSGTPVRTLAVYDVLICSKQIESDGIYDMVGSIFNFKARLARDNFEFALLNDDFDSHTFLFPLHAGTTAYLNRNKPPFWERYAELVGVVISVIAVSAGAASTAYHKLKQRKKDKIDEYYMKVISISSRSYYENFTPNELRSLLDQLLQIRLEVFQLLVDERISANNAFIIFLLLAQSTVEHLESRLEQTESCLDIDLS